MKRLNTLFLAVFAMLFIFGCSKDDEGENLTKEQMLAGETSKTWTLVSVKMMGIETIQDNQKDDEETFSRNGDYSKNYGEDESDFNSTGSWMFNDDKSEVIVTIGEDYSLTYKVKSLSSKKLILETDLNKMFGDWGGETSGDPIMIEAEYVPAN